MRRRDLDKVAAGEAAAAERIGILCGLDDTMAIDTTPRHVGWMQLAPSSVKGVNHLCITCQPTRPGKGHWEPVTAIRLAATLPCTKCGVVLELVGLHEPAQKVKPAVPK